MSTISGIGGNVDGHGTVRNWIVDSDVDIQTFSASNTKAGTGAVDGNTDWSGSFSQYGHLPAVFPGNSFTFQGTIEGTLGLTGTALVESVTINVDIEAGSIIETIITFAANGVLTKGAVASGDSTVPCPPSSLNAEIWTQAPVDPLPAYPGAFVKMADVRNFSLAFTTTNPTFASSDTSGGIRRAAGNLAASLSVEVYTADFSTLPTENLVQDIVAVVDNVPATNLFWRLRFIKWGSISNMTVDIETPGMVGATLEGIFTGFTDIGGTCEEGIIVDSGATPITRWPV